MYENRHISEPKWKSWIVQTTTPLFTPEQCRQIIASGRAQQPQVAQVGMNKPGGGTDTKKRVTTVAVDKMRFHKPIMVGDIVSFYTEVNKTGTTSITIDITTMVTRKNNRLGKVNTKEQSCLREG